MFERQLAALRHKIADAHRLNEPENAIAAYTKIIGEKLGRVDNCSPPPTWLGLSEASRRS